MLKWIFHLCAYFIDQNYFVNLLRKFVYYLHGAAIENFMSRRKLELFKAVKLLVYNLFSSLPFPDSSVHFGNNCVSAWTLLMPGVMTGECLRRASMLIGKSVQSPYISAGVLHLRCRYVPNNYLPLWNSTYEICYNIHPPKGKSISWNNVFFN